MLEGFEMANLRSVLAAVTFVAIGLGSAHANPIVGSLSISGADSYNMTADTITFGGSFDIVGTGDFLPFIAGTPVSMRDPGTPVSYAGTNFATGSLLGCGAGCLFKTTIGLLTAELNVTSYTATEGLT